MTIQQQDAFIGTYDDDAQHYDALLIVSFGGPEGMDDVMPFLETVLNGKNIPHERMLEVADHYALFDGVSPINSQTRALIVALGELLDAEGPNLPLYWGNRNWHPFLVDALRQMRDDGIKRALAFFPSPYSSYSSCRQYREDIERARAEVGPDAPEIDRIRMFFNHPGFIQASADHLRAALDEVPPEGRDGLRVAFTAHSIPLAMAQGSRYVTHLTEASRLVAEDVGLAPDSWQLVYQSRSGPPHQPWLEPDIRDHLHDLHAAGVKNVVIMPIGFISDHIEVLFDLDTQAKEVAGELGMGLWRASTAGIHPAFVAMIRELIAERMAANPTRRALGQFGPYYDICAADCCLPGHSGRPPAHKG